MSSDLFCAAMTALHCCTSIPLTSLESPGSTSTDKPEQPTHSHRIHQVEFEGPSIQLCDTGQPAMETLEALEATGRNDEGCKQGVNPC